MDILLSTLYSTVASGAFAFIFNIRGRKILYAALGGGLSWLIYSICLQYIPEEVVCYFISSVCVSLYSELFARLCKTPVTVYLVVGIIPLVPGWLAYSTMKAFISGDVQLFLDCGLRTLSIAGGIAIGVFLVSSVMRLITISLRKKRKSI